MTAAPIVLGGAGFTLFPRDLLRATGADWGVVGDGETFPALLSLLERGGDPDVLPPGVVRGGETGPVDPVRWPGPFPRTLPDPASDHVAFYLRRGGMLNLQTKRGCPFHCVYCTYPAIEGRALRLLDPGDVGRTAVGLERAGARYVFVCDALFNAHPAHSLECARAMRSSGLTVPWGAFFGPLSPPEGYYAGLRAAGLTHVEFGTDALSDPVLRAYGKGFTVAEALAAHRAARAAGLHVAHYFTPGGPGETPDTLAETLDRAEALDGAVLFFFCGLRIYPGTALHALALREGQVTPDDDLVAPVYYQSPGLTTDAIVAAVRRRAAGRACWVVGSGGARMARIVERYHARGRVGPLWEGRLAQGGG